MLYPNKLMIWNYKIMEPVEATALQIQREGEHN